MKFPSLRRICEQLNRIEESQKRLEKLMSAADTLITQVVAAEAAMETRIDAAVTLLAQEIKTLQGNPTVSAQSIQNLQNLQAALASFKGKETITITPATANVAQGATQQFSADVDVTWAVTTGTGTIDANGLFTAPAAAETDTITATATDGSTATATAVVS